MPAVTGFDFVTCSQALQSAAGERSFWTWLSSSPQFFTTLPEAECIAVFQPSGEYQRETRYFDVFERH
jgi:hypothetical protein